MPEPKEGNYREIEILEERLAKLKEALGATGGQEAPSGKELLREAVRERIREALPLPPAPIPHAPPAPIAPSAAKTPHDELVEVKAFVDLAFSRDIPSAVKAVYKSGNAHLIDAFHDVLVDRLFDELVKLGKLK
jgi:hypothetical protein